MARQRTGIVRESRSELIALRDSLGRDGDRKKVSMLLVIVSDPSIGTEALADRLDVSRPTIKRWWSAYQRGGLEALVGVSAGPIPPPAVDTDARGDERWIEFLGSLPTSTDTIEWSGGLQRALVRLFDDVDRVSVVVNTMCDLVAPEAYRPVVAAIEYGGREEVSRVVIDREGKDDRLRERIRDFARQGFPVDDYHPPIGVPVTFAGVAHLGSLYFWRSRDRDPIGESTVATIERMAGFFEFVLSDAVARIRLAQPVLGEFDEAFNAYIGELDLTRSQIRVALLLVQGRRQEEIADVLDLSINTVRSHLRTIYRRAGVSSAHEFIARYASPRFASGRSAASTHGRRRK